MRETIHSLPSQGTSGFSASNHSTSCPLRRMAYLDYRPHGRMYAKEVRPSSFSLSLSHHPPSPRHMTLQKT